MQYHSGDRWFFSSIRICQMHFTCALENPALRSAQAGQAGSVTGVVAEPGTRNNKPETVTSPLTVNTEPQPLFYQQRSIHHNSVPDCNLMQVLALVCRMHTSILNSCCPPEMFSV